jgi:hypothetical protein
VSKRANVTELQWNYGLLTALKLELRKQQCYDPGVDADDPYKPPQAEIELPPEPEPPERDGEHYALGVALAGVFLLLQMVWKNQWPTGVVLISAFCMAVGFREIWRIRQRRKRWLQNRKQ